MLVPPRNTSPSTMAPGTVSCIRFRQRSIVDLPQPDGPITAVTDESGKSRLTFRRTRFFPNHALRRCAFRRSVTAACIPTSGCVPGDETDDEDEGDEDERASPRLRVGRFIRTNGIGKDLQRERCYWLAQRSRPELVAERGEKKRSS